MRRCCVGRNARLRQKRDYGLNGIKTSRGQICAGGDSGSRHAFPSWQFPEVCGHAPRSLPDQCKLGPLRKRLRSPEVTPTSKGRQSRETASGTSPPALPSDHTLRKKPARSLTFWPATPNTTSPVRRLARRAGPPLDTRATTTLSSTSVALRPSQGRGGWFGRPRV